ncbi:SufD family Fe-S cluster assembly protein [Candidatus Woesearchaeota archaeon]|nr:SufD family Fe-S cluster assembly protein [Candidatus Woesearchaeota archaeon]
MKLNIKEDIELIINEKLISIITKPNTNSKIILLEPKKVQIKLGTNSKLSLYTIFKNSKVIKQVELSKNSELKCYDLIINTSLESNISLDGTNASFINKSLSYSTKDSVINTIVNHNSKETRSSILNKNLIGKNSLVKCSGKILIPQKSINCKSNLKSESLLLDNTSKCDATPILEIFNDQVSCSHSASISYINQDKLYYLNSRGLNEKNATELLLEAFAQTILIEMPEQIIERSKEVLK